jgi:hypothetical protein
VHPFSNGAVLEKLGIPEVPGNVDSESAVDVTTSRSPCKTMVDVWTLEGPLKVANIPRMVRDHLTGGVLVDLTDVRAFDRSKRQAISLDKAHRTSRFAPRSKVQC